ncbi:MAG: hypothetical protein IPM18_05805 [Phycisphaerales bacterium]|nr:hypothetical protein [Phycisphaerales bacterium]
MARRSTTIEPATVVHDPLDVLLQHRAAERDEALADERREQARRADCWYAVVAALGKVGATPGELRAAAEAAAELSLNEDALRDVHEALKERERLESLASELAAREAARQQAVREVVAFAESAERRLRELKLTSSCASAAKRAAMAARDELARWPERHPELHAALNNESH